VWAMESPAHTRDGTKRTLCDRSRPGSRLVYTAVSSAFCLRVASACLRCSETAIYQSDEGTNVSVSGCLSVFMLLYKR